MPSSAGMNGVVAAVSSNPAHTLSKPQRDSIRLLSGLGVEGDAHAGEAVKHRSRVARDPTAPNRRQVHLIHAELHDELAEAGFAVTPGLLGENVTTRGVKLLALPAGAPAPRRDRGGRGDRACATPAFSSTACSRG